MYSHEIMAILRPGSLLVNRHAQIFRVSTLGADGLTAVQLEACANERRVVRQTPAQLLDALERGCVSYAYPQLN